MELPKETTPDVAAGDTHGRWYDDACGTAFAMEIVGERWAMLVVRELLLGPRRFSDLRASLPGISAKVLTQRLTALEQAGVLVHRTSAAPAPVPLYELTAWGQALEPALLELGRWATMHGGHNPRLPLSPVALMLSLRTTLNVSAAEGMRLSAGFTVAGQSFLAELDRGAMPVRRAPAGEGMIGFAAPEPLPLLRLFYGKQPLAEAQRAGVEIRGHAGTVQRFIALFALPQKLA